RSQWQADWENWQNVGQWRGFVGGGGQRLDFDSQDSAASGDGNAPHLAPVRTPPPPPRPPGRGGTPLRRAGTATV
ncbi:hypothetical protein KZ874_21270, partial [Pseudomonas aeruginosa]|nr:hypothetical protein [Pseudomonas aeruginosa]